MSSAGIYNYHPKVAHPNKIFHQMESGGFQPPFYFGGSQVPVNLGFQGQGLKSSHLSHLDHMKYMPIQGRGKHTTVQKMHKVYLPKHLPTIKKVI